MEVYANLRQEVNIDPIDVIEKLIDQENGYSLFEENGKYYYGYEISAGCHSYSEKKDISKDVYDYVQHLKAVLKFLSNNNK